jgi:hypothetical protein
MPATSPALDTPSFSLGPGQITSEPAGSRVALHFVAPAQRHLDGGFEADVYIVLFDAKGRFIRRRSNENRVVLANRAAWTHEVEKDALAQGARFIYEISHRFDVRRKILAGELPSLPAEADGSDYYRWLQPDPRNLDDRVVRIDFELWARNSGIEITIGHHPKLPTDSCRTDFDLELLDDQRAVQFMRSFSASTNRGWPAYADASLSMDRKAMRALRFFELRGRTEMSALVRLEVDAMP